MSQHPVRYQSELLTDLIQNAETHTTLSSAEAEHLRQRVAQAASEPDIADRWAELDQHYDLLDEDQWAT